MDPERARETVTHRLILPRDTNHHGTLYAGNVLTIALEAAYAAAYQAIGPGANLVLKRVLDLRCRRPVPSGVVIAIRGSELLRARVHDVIGVRADPLPGEEESWMDAIMQFVQVDPSGRPVPLPDREGPSPSFDSAPWRELQSRASTLLKVRVRENGSRAVGTSADPARGTGRDGSRIQSA